MEEGQAGGVLGEAGDDVLRWECGVPGKEKTDWEGAVFRVVLTFSGFLLFFFVVVCFRRCVVGSFGIGGD